MKRAWIFLPALACVFGLSACTGGEELSESVAPPASQTADRSSVTAEPPSSAQESEPGKTSGSHILIAYFTMPEDVDPSGADAIARASIVVQEGEIMGNVEYMASVIQNTIGGDLFQIQTVQQYPLDHDTLVDQAVEEQDADARPELSTHIENLDQYDTILLGYPNWWGTCRRRCTRSWRSMTFPARRSSLSARMEEAALPVQRAPLRRCSRTPQ